MSQVRVFARPLHIIASPELQKLFKAHTRVHPDLLWRICNIQSYSPELVDHPLKRTFLPEGLCWDPENKWKLEEAEDLGADM